MISTICTDDDREFIQKIYENYYPIMKKKVYEVLKDYSCVDDIINDSFIKLIGKIKTLKNLDDKKLVAYLVYTVKNTAIDYIKKSATTNKNTYFGLSNDLLNEIPDLKENPEQILSNKELKLDLWAAIDKVSDTDKVLLYNKYILELSDREISELMNIPTANIRTYMTRARRRVLSILVKEAK